MGRISRGNRAIRWIEEYCHVPEGKDVGNRVKLRPWQKKIIKGIYDDPTRRVIISFARKNGKTALSAFLCLLHLCGPEARRNSQLYSCAQSRDQAAILFNLMTKVVRQSTELDAFIGVRESAKQLYCDELGTLYRALSAESTTAMGLSPVFVVHDELGQVRGPRFPLYSALETAAGAQEDPLSVIISTQAAEDGDLLSQLIDDALAGHDSETKCFLYTADEKLDPFSIKAIKQANPAYGDFLNSKEVRRLAQDAYRMPSQEADYRNLNLNQRIARTAAFVSQRVWSENGLSPRLEDFKNGVIVGIDLSQRVDLTAMAYVGRGDDGNTSVICEFFAPEYGLRERSITDRVPYDLWAEQGYLTLTPGKTVGFDFVCRRLGEICREFGVENIQYDRFKFQELVAELRNQKLDDLPIDEKGHGQGFVGMGPAVDILEAELLNGRLRHGNNPILEWCASNAVITPDAAGNRKFDKKRATGRIDGIVALAMALHHSVVRERDKGSLDDFLNNVVGL